jgi:hypothetical protein
MTTEKLVDDLVDAVNEAYDAYAALQEAILKVKEASDKLKGE